MYANKKTHIFSKVGLFDNLHHAFPWKWFCDLDMLNGFTVV